MLTLAIGFAQASLGVPTRLVDSIMQSNSLGVELVALLGFHRRGCWPYRWVTSACESRSSSMSMGY